MLRLRTPGRSDSRGRLASVYSSVNLRVPERSGVGAPLPSNSPCVCTTASDLLPPKTVRSSAPTARLSGDFAKGDFRTPTSPLAEAAITCWRTSVVWKVGVDRKASICGVMVPAAPNRFTGTQPPLVTVQDVVFSARTACCSLVDEKPLPVVCIWSERPDWK